MYRFAIIDVSCLTTVSDMHALCDYILHMLQSGVRSHYYNQKPLPRVMSEYKHALAELNSAAQRATTMYDEVIHNNYYY
jgi:hypothetical protein